MNYSICLDPTTVNNFNVNNLSSNGFSIYTNLNYTTPLQTGIPFDQLFTSPLGTCPYIIDLPLGVTQIIVVDNCIQPPVSSDLSGNAVIANCCYAILDIPQEPVPWCEECNLSFNVFNTSSIGQIIAGTLSSTCGTVTDYTIGWYRDGDYSSPEFISGFGNAFLPYDNLHPLTGQQAVPCLAGDWEGIIHDIAIGGITYSSIAGTANGVPIPFESCFDTVVVNPLTCANGPVSSSISKYSHQFNYNSQAVGTTSSPVSLTYVLDASTKYFAYHFTSFSVWDELEIKWISGDPSVTSNPSLYSQPIYLEKLRIGGDVPAIPPTIWDPINPLTTNRLPKHQEPLSPNNNIIANNVWPKTFPIDAYIRTLTLTTLETSSNPSLPDRLEITITPNPTNNNTAWIVGFQCLSNFTCNNCVWDNYPNNLLKIKKIRLKKTYNGCNSTQQLELTPTSSCPPSSITSDWMGYNSPNGLNSPTLSLVAGGGGNSPDFINFPNPSPLTLSSNIYCSYGGTNPSGCGPSSTGTITLDKTPYQIKLTFNLQSDYFYYKNDLYNNFLNSSFISQGTSINTPISCLGTTNIDYYRIFSVSFPIQDPNANCGDNTSGISYLFHFNDYFNTQYNENPSSNSWSIIIPQSPIVNCYPLNQPCDSCNSTISTFVNNYNSQVNNLSSFTFTTYVGAKYSNPFSRDKINRFVTGNISGSYCFTLDNNQNGSIYSIVNQSYSWYATHTLPFVSSSTGWTNLNSLVASVPCLPSATSSFPNLQNDLYRGAMYKGGLYGYQIRFPHLTSSFNYAFGPGNSYSTNDFEIYTLTNITNTGSWNNTPNSYPLPCPDPLGSLIYRYSGSIATMYSSSYFFGGVAPTLVIDP
jgi:hypothetical protein